MLVAQPGHAAPATGNQAAAAPEKEAKPAKAEKATSIAEPDTLALFLLGATGLILGRRLSRSKRRRPS